MKKIFSGFMTVALVGAMVFGCTAFAAEEEAVGGVVVVPNEDSATGYTATFTYYDDNAASVALQGSFCFYEVGDEYMYAAGVLNEDGGVVDTENHLFTPDEWTAGMVHYGDDSFLADMDFDEETGAWTISLDLPGGSYLYQYVVTDAEGNEETITDPENIPYSNTLGASQERSQFYVPYDSEKQAESDDWTFVSPADSEDDRGTLIWDTYEGYAYDGADTSLQEVMVYLPAHYDADREEPYKTLYLVHGGGGEEGDWFSQGNAGNIMDRLAADGETEEFVMVAIDISVGSNEELAENLVEYTIPYVEENYNVSTEAEDRALAGLSKGTGFAYAVEYGVPDTFGYFGFFSRGYSSDEYDILEGVNTNVAKLYLGGGFADKAIGPDESDPARVPMPELAEYLDENGVEYTGLVMVEGGHDWFTWPQLLEDFIENFLWK